MAQAPDADMPAAAMHQADPDVIACTQETLRRHAAGPPVTQPTREQLLTALTR
jgi:hypothetical protein